MPKFNKSYIFILFNVLVVFSCKVQTKLNADLNSYLSTPISLIEHLKYSSSWKPMISVHRGGGEMQNYPENCIESFDYFAKAIPSIIECDIEMSKDSVLFMMHDNSLDRTTTSSGKIIEKNFKDFSDAKLKDNFGNVTSYRIPLLAEILKYGKNKVIYTLDVKKNTPYRLVVKEVEKQNAENYSVIITYNLNQAVEVYKLNQDLMISVGIMKIEDYDRLREAGIPDKNMIAFIGTREPNKELIDFLHSKKILTILGTLGNLDKKAASNSEKPYTTWKNQGVDIFSTDRPIEAFKAINQ